MARYRRPFIRRFGPGRIVAILVAVTAGGYAYSLMPETDQQPVVVERIIPPDVEDVLVASVEIGRGVTLAGTNVKWQPWPRAAITPALIRRSEAPRFIEEMKESQARVAFSAMEPIRRDRLTRDDRAGAPLAELIPVGSRAVAISIDGQGSSTAGGFILPKDRVDVIRTFVSEGDNPKPVSETLLKNVRVLAIGQATEQKPGEAAVSGVTATLEVDPKQAERLILAQRTGQLSLALRSFAETAKEEPAAAVVEPSRAVVTVVRNGARQDYTVRESEPKLQQALQPRGVKVAAGAY